MLPKDYNNCVGFPTMVINALQNKRDGPGGSARRLHQPNGFSDGYPVKWLKPSDLWGRNRIDVRGKIKVFTRYCTTVIGLFLQMQTIMKHLR